MASPARPAVRVEWADRVATIVLDRREVHNALDRAAWMDLARAAEAAESGGARVLLITGEGRSFSSGSDLRELARADHDEVEDVFVLMESVISRFEHLSVPSVAVLKGYAMGSALVLACACDLRVAVGELRAGMPVGRLGIALGGPFLRRLNALLGPARTKDLILTGRVLSAVEALRFGLVEYDLPERSVGRLADAVAAMYPGVVRAAKSALAPPPTGERAYVITDEASFREGLARFLHRRGR